MWTLRFWQMQHRSRAAASPAADRSRYQFACATRQQLKHPLLEIVKSAPWGRSGSGTIMTMRLSTRRQFLAAGAASAASFGLLRQLLSAPDKQPAQIVISLDLEMSAEYPQRGMTEWNYRKGDLDAATKDYAVRAAELVKSYGGVLHFFCVGQVLEQPDVGWLKSIAEAGHPIGNHTYDHIFMKAKTPRELQFRFQRAPWLLRDAPAIDLVRENILLATKALQERVGITPRGFRTPGGFHNGLHDRPDVQQLLLDAGYTWVSSLYPAHQSGVPKEPPPETVFENILQVHQKTQPFAYPSGLIEIPMSPISDVTAFRTHWWKQSDFLRAIRANVQWTLEHGGVFDFLAHPSCLVVEDPDLEVIRSVCEQVQTSRGQGVICSMDDVASRVKSSLPDRKDHLNK